MSHLARVGSLSVEETARPLVVIGCADLLNSTTFSVRGCIARALWGTAGELGAAGSTGVTGAEARVTSPLAKEAFAARNSTGVSGVHTRWASNLACPLVTLLLPVASFSANCFCLNAAFARAFTDGGLWALGPGEGMSSFGAITAAFPATARRGLRLGGSVLALFDATCTFFREDALKLYHKGQQYMLEHAMYDTI